MITFSHSWERIKKKRVTSLISPFRDSACKKLCFRDQLHTVRNIPCIRIRPICRKQCIAEELQQIHRDNINSYNLNNCSTLPPIKRLDSRAILRIYCMKIALNSLQLCPLRQAARSAVSSDTFCTIFQNAAFGLSDMRGPLWVWCCLWGNFAPAAAAPLGSWDDRLFPRRVDNGKRPGQSLAWGMVRRSIFVRPATLETPLDLEEKKRTMWKQLKNLSRNLDKNALDIISFVQPFSSLVSPDTDESFSSNFLSSITLSALTNIFFRSGLTISSRNTLWTCSYCGQSFSFGGLARHLRHDY